MLINNLFLVKLSFYPLIFSLMIFCFINSMNLFFWFSSYMLLNTFFFIFMIMILLYFFLLINESMFLGLYSYKKKFILSNGFLLFIMSELMVFFSLFWSYIHNAYSPNIFMGNYWPPKGLIPANPTSMIIFGTSILLSSSLIIMISHYSYMLKSNYLKSKFYLLISILMGLIFIDMQILEMSNFFMKLNFNFNDSIFSSSFLFTTSLHASHVILGLLGLLLSFFFFNKCLNNLFFYLNLEFSIWYWHFVDYIWIGVFSLFYYFNN